MPATKSKKKLTPAQLRVQDLSPATHEYVDETIAQALDDIDWYISDLVAAVTSWTVQLGELNKVLKAQLQLELKLEKLPKTPAQVLARMKARRNGHQR